MPGGRRSPKPGLHEYLCSKHIELMLDPHQGKPKWEHLQARVTLSFRKGYKDDPSQAQAIFLSPIDASTTSTYAPWSYYWSTRSGAAGPRRELETDLAIRRRRTRSQSHMALSNPSGGGAFFGKSWRPIWHRGRTVMALPPTKFVSFVVIPMPSLTKASPTPKRGADPRILERTSSIAAR